MIKKIISGGQTGAEQAALDAAIQFQISHGGWIHGCRETESGRLPNKYKLTELPAGSYSEGAEQNIIDSEGTLFLSHGNLVGLLRYTQEKTDKHSKPFLHIDLEKINDFQAAYVVKKWASENKIETLNVTGPKLSEDKYIYQTAIRLLTTAFHMEMIENSMSDPMNPTPLLPETIEGVIERLIVDLPLRDKVHIANMKEVDLVSLYPTLGSYIRNRYLRNGNEPLILDCMHKSGRDDIDENKASSIIIQTLWEQLQKTHRLRIVK